jgi:D-serine deaminase-like pyridoxal phosphate-dependent protein
MGSTAELLDQFVGQSKEKLPTPALLVDEEKLMGNLLRMAAFLAGGPTRVRPHAKSHKCSALARRQIEAGAVGITVATVQEAESMAAGGIADILVANQVVNDYWLARLVRLAGRCDLKATVDSETNAVQLSQAATRAGAELGVVVEVDVGMGRCGAEPLQPACELAHRVAELPNLCLRGFMGYEGHAVNIQNRSQREATCRQAMSLLLSTVEMARSQGLEVEIVSGGGTGTFDITGRIPGVTEIQAGSYALMDLTYRRVLTDFECAMTVLTTVISRPAPDRAVLDAGLKSMSTEFGLPQPASLQGAVLRDLAEEHGILEVAGPGAELRCGDRVELLPTHGCTTVAWHPYLFLTRGFTVVDVWEVDGRRHS